MAAQSKSIYVVSTGPAAGKSLITFGMMDYLLGKSRRIGCFQPIATTSGNVADELQLIAEHCQLDLGNQVVTAYSEERARALIADEGRQALHKGILQAYKKLEADCDFVLCAGTDYSGPSATFEFEFNLEIALNLGAPVIPVINGSGIGGGQTVDHLSVVHSLIRSHNVSIVATIVSRVPAAALEERRSALDDAFGSGAVFVLPEDEALARPTVQDVADTLQARVFEGNETSLKREVRDIKVAAMGLPNFLSYISEGGLVIVPGDRADILAGSLLADRSDHYPKLACLVLSGGLMPDERVYRLMTGSEATRLPILSLQEDTFSVVRAIQDVKGWLSADHPQKVARALHLFRSAVDMEQIDRHFVDIESTAMTPLMFEHQLLARAATKRRRIVLPEAEDERILQAAAILLVRGVADIVLLGNPETVGRRAIELNLDLADAEVIDPLNTPLRETFVDTYLELRRHKGVNRDVAEDVMADPSYFGTMMVHLGHADGMVSGAVNTTAHTLRPSFEFIKTRPGVALVSSVFFMCLEDRVLVYGDCAVNPKPSAAELADIAASAADTAANFGVDPRVAMLSYSSGESGKGEEVERVREATALVQQSRPSLAVEGPIQYDAAADMAVARSKMPESVVAGRATVYIFPDLNAGNNAYKAVQRTANAVAVGPVLQGLNKPVNDLSRGCTVTDIVNTVAITAIQARSTE